MQIAPGTSYSDGYALSDTLCRFHGIVVASCRAGTATVRSRRVASYRPPRRYYFTLKEKLYISVLLQKVIYLELKSLSMKQRIFRDSTRREKISEIFSFIGNKFFFLFFFSSLILVKISSFIFLDRPPSLPPSHLPYLSIITLYGRGFAPSCRIFCI